MSRPKSRNGSDSAADASLAEKKKARHRLVGAIALCLVAAFVVPMLLESEPRTGLRSLPMTVEAAANSTRADQPWIRPPVADEAARSVMPDQVVMLEEGAAGQPAASGQGAPRAPGDQPSVNPPDLSARTGQDPETPATPAVPPSSPQPARSAASDTAAGRGRAAAGQDAANQARPARPATAPSGNTTQRPANAPLPKPLPMTQGGAQSDADSRPDVLARLIDQVDSGSNAARPTHPPPPEPWATSSCARRSPPSRPWPPGTPRSRRCSCSPSTASSTSWATTTPSPRRRRRCSTSSAASC